MSGTLTFDVVAEDASSQARAGVIATSRCQIETPVFMPVGTRATVKAQTQEMLEDLGAQIILANTYHLYLRPGEQLIRELGGLHRFMSWERAILTDSGGFQVLSLAPLRKVSDEGVSFQSHLDGSRHLLTPEKAIEIQADLGSDIAMVLDECIENPAERAKAERAVTLTTLWAQRCKARSGQLQEQRESYQSLFGIIQGSVHPDLRQRSLHDLLEIGFDG
jgi:queuine tRNA-ribosyltransferase